MIESSFSECFLVNAHLNKAWEDQIWKKTTKTGYNLANYSMNQSMSVSINTQIFTRIRAFHVIFSRQQSVPNRVN